MGAAGMGAAGMGVVSRASRILEKYGWLARQDGRSWE